VTRAGGSSRVNQQGYMYRIVGWVRAVTSTDRALSASHRGWIKSAVRPISTWILTLTYYPIPTNPCIIICSFLSAVIPTRARRVVQLRCLLNPYRRILPATSLKRFHFLKFNNSVALVRERTISTERTPLVAEVNANVCG
jgi:hypothetical protein